MVTPNDKSIIIFRYDNNLSKAAIAVYDSKYVSTIYNIPYSSKYKDYFSLMSSLEGGGNCSGYLFECMLYNYSVSDGELFTIVPSLRRKWGLGTNDLIYKESINGMK